jgi:small subunit ribosomal protein S16
MAVAIRFSRQGKKRSPFYRIVAADKRCARDGRFIELLGTYHPLTKVLKIDAERYDKWLKVGARPSGTLAAVIRRVNRAAARDIKPPISPVGPGSGAAGAKKSA